MQNRKRLTNMLIAGTLTVFALTIFLAFRGGETAVAETTIPEQTAVVELSGDNSADIAALQAQIEGLQAQNAELRTAVTTLQEREVEYQNQIEIANQTINELSAQNGSFVMTEGRPAHGGHNH
ncbi:MAG: hypothetical protein H6662_09910 [Ardenticatenaceae bacterium]|nr:hypothetical protein [Ardenticatenaceae bacterium]MCB8992203.1 hypothetical protein [Ardenticatenaceae bacterium]